MSNSVWILFAVLSTLDGANGSEYHHIPRIILTDEDVPFRRHSRNGTHTRTELILGPHSDSIYAGGHRSLLYIDFQTPDQSKEVTIFENECRDKGTKGSCEYDITLLHAIKDGAEIFVCGTNGILPQCCYMTQAEFGSCSSISAEGIAPFSVKEKAPSLYIEDELYTTANLYTRGDGVGIRRHFGLRGKISSRANKTEQRFVAMATSGPRADPLQDRIYMFLVERNLDKHPEADHWIPRVIQVCKADRGGTKNLLERVWTSLQSARLYCGIDFSKILDVDVLHAANWRDSKVYALFTNTWGMRAVCVYTMGTIDDIFMKSKFKNSPGSAPNGQRRMCVKNSKTLPQEVLKQMKDYQEMESWIRPVKDSAPLLVSHRHYRHIRADSVIGQSHVPHVVLFLSLDNGKVHKVLGQTGAPFIIAELQPFRNRTHIQNMLLQPSTKKMYVSSSSEVVELDLRSCMKYSPRCEDCVQARDPYCGWDGTKCTASTSETVQDVEHGNYTVCKESEGGYERTLAQYEVRLESRTHVQKPLAPTTTQSVSSSREVVEQDLHSCKKHGQRCEDCVQARDPHCGWDGTKCTAASSETVQDVEHGNYKVCEEAGKSDKYVPLRSLLPSTKYVLLCPIVSAHAEYRWHHRGRRIECLMAEGQCLLLIESMSPELEGNYSCVSTEGGYERTLAQYEVRLDSRAGGQAAPFLATIFLLVSWILLN